MHPLPRRVATLLARLLALPLAVALPDVAGAAVHQETRSLGMAGAVLSDPVANSSMGGNPAGLARSYVYGLEVDYFRAGPGELNAVGFNIVDSKTQPSLAVGVAYGYEFTDPKAEDKVDAHDARMSFAHPLLPNQLSLGVGLHYMHFNRSGGPPDLTSFTMDAGLVASVTPGLHFGLCGQNLIDVADPEFPMLAGGGVAYTGSLATLDFDTMVDFTTQDSPKPVFHGGLEFLLGRVVPLRAGVERNEATQLTRVGGGLGFMTAEDQSQGSQLNLAFLKGIEVKKDFHFGVGFILFM